LSSDFESIGFNFRSPQEFVEFAQREVGRGHAQRTPVDGEYVRLGNEDGAQLWIQRSPSNEVIGAHPHFAGSSRFRAALSRVIRPSGRDTPLDGSIVCTASPDADSVPFVAAVPDFWMRAASLPAQSQLVLQVTLFPRECHISRTLEEHQASPLGKLASEALIPAGLFRPNGAHIEPPQNQMIAAGRIVAVREVLNPVTQIRFLTLLVRTLGGEVDVPMAATACREIPGEGSILAGSFAVSARVLEAIPATQQPDRPTHQPLIDRKQSLLKRLFGG
jgi:hypothetical protein